MDGMASYVLGKLLYEDRLREAEHRAHMWRSNRFNKLPRLVQVLLAVLS